MTPDLLQGYYFNVAAQRYMRAGKAGFVARHHILSLLERVLDGQERTINAATISALDGELAPSVWLARTKALIKDRYLQAAALGAGGWDRLTQTDYGRIGAKLRVQYQYLQGFAEEIAEGTVSQAQALNRIRMYLGGAYAEFYVVERDRLPLPPVGKAWWERRILGVAEHCEDCIEYAEMGWQPAGVLPVPTQMSRCGGNCRCELTRKLVDAGGRP